MRPTTTHPIEKDLSSVASIGAQGQYSHKCYVDLMKTVEANMTLPLPHRERMRFKTPLGEQVQEILLPHEFFAALYEHDATFLWLGATKVWCFSGEDMQKRVQQLAKASVKGNNSAQAVKKIVRHYRLAMKSHALNTKKRFEQV